MSLQNAEGLIIRMTDFSETSRIVTLWTRESGKVRALAKGGRRLKSPFESALDLLNVCSIVRLHKTSGGLDLLTEARVVRRFPNLTKNLSALYAGYYLAEILNDLTQDEDPHPRLFEEALVTLENLGQPGVLTGPCIARFELTLLRELGFGPVWEKCVGCGSVVDGPTLAYSTAGGGVVCAACSELYSDRRFLAAETLKAIQLLRQSGDSRQQVQDPVLRKEIRQLLDHTMNFLLGHRPRVQPYLGS